jgi:hypothetical protein
MSDPREQVLLDGLRLQALLSEEVPGERHIVTLATMAADRIKALEAEVDSQKRHILALQEAAVTRETWLKNAEAEVERLREALRNLVKMNEEHNAAVEAVIGRPLNWSDNYLDEARAALAGEGDE